jgi:hypothetical protein
MMSRPRQTRRPVPLFLLVGAAALASLAGATAPVRAQAFVAPAAPGAGYYYPGPSYGYPPPYPYAYNPVPPYYPPPGAYPPAASAPPAPVGATPLPGFAAAATVPPAPGSPAATAVAPGFGYTNRPAFINASGQTCREYKATDLRSGRPVDVYGTACRQPDGQWRVIN